MVGKYGRGPSVEVTGNDTLVYLTLGSEVAVINLADPARPRVLSEIQFGSLSVQSHLRDSLLFVGGYGAVEVWNVSRPAEPVFRSRIPGGVRWYGISDFYVSDTLLYLIRQDTFMVYGVRSPANPQLLGYYPDSGYVLAASGGTVIAGHQRQGLIIIDVSNPASPHRVANLPVGFPLSAEARGSLCCVSMEDYAHPYPVRFVAYDISNPASVRELGRLGNAGGHDIFLWDTLAFVSGRQRGGEEFQIISIADSIRPWLIGACATPGDNWGVWASPARSRAFVADRTRGLAVLDITDMSAPRYETRVLTAGYSVDLDVSGDIACIASDQYGLVVLDVSEPSRPVQLGALDSTTNLVTRTVAMKDSIAYMGLSPSFQNFRSVNIADPERPVSIGGTSLFNWPEDMAVRDSFAYCAEFRRFEVINVARPRSPVLVGSCVTQEDAGGLCVVDSLAYAANYPFAIINVKQPTSPTIVSTIARGAWNGTVRDTFLFLSSGGVLVYSVADPRNPQILDSVSLGPNTYWVEAVGSLLYTGNRDGVRAVDASDVHNMRVVGFGATPYIVKRLCYSAPYVYAACWDAGVCIFESTQVGVAEGDGHGSSPVRPARIQPNPTTGRCLLAATQGWSGRVVIRDAAGRVVVSECGQLDKEGRCILNLAGLKAGVYFVDAGRGGSTGGLKLVKQ